MKIDPGLDATLQALSREEAVDVLRSLVTCEWVKPKVAETMISVVRKRALAASKAAPAKSGSVRAKQDNG